MTPSSIVAIYDFELFPYALGDVLTWNVRTAMRCEELGRERVDVYICTDERFPAGIYQRGLVNAQNFELFFSELYSAFGTHPRLGNIHIFREREALLAELQRRAVEDEVNAEAVADYLGVLELRVSENVLGDMWRTLAARLRGNRFIRAAFKRYVPSSVKSAVRNSFPTVEQALNNYFIKYIHSHESINEFAARRGQIPFLHPALGCVPDIDELIAKRFSGKKIVPFHLRLRRLDAGYGGEDSYTRDSDFLEWYDFLRTAAVRYPEVEFVALGRLQEKPLELLRLPNVSSLRVFGMGLGHELTLMLKSDLFIGTSSGFAAFANFSRTPYFITRMNPGSCHAYAIQEGADRLPFATDSQKLIYAPETSELLMDLLESGLRLKDKQSDPDVSQDTEDDGSQTIDVRRWLVTRAQSKNSAATTSRFYTDEKYRHEETAFLILPALEKAKRALVENARAEADVILRRLENNFPLLCRQLPQYQLLREMTDKEGLDPDAMRAGLDVFDIRVSDVVGSPCSTDAGADTGWRAGNWVAAGGVCRPLPGADAGAFDIQGHEQNSYWHTEKFFAERPDGKLIVRFDAKNSLASSRHRAYLFEDGAYRSVGDVVVVNAWQRFEIFVTAKPSGVLEFQIDQPDAWQWLSVRNFRIVGASSLPDGARHPTVTGAPAPLPMSAWSKPGEPCRDDGGNDCRHWSVAGKKGYIQTPILPPPGNAGLLVRFEARTDKLPASFTSLYLFEGDKYKTIAQCALGPEWREFVALLQPESAKPIKLQVDYPESVESLWIRNFQSSVVDRL